MLLDLFLVRLFFHFSVCPVRWTKLATRQLFYCTLHNIVSYRIVHWGEPCSRLSWIAKAAKRTKDFADMLVSHSVWVIGS